jgi:hypothetical protein
MLELAQLLDLLASHQGGSELRGANILPSPTRRQGNSDPTILPCGMPQNGQEVRPRNTASAVHHAEVSALKLGEPFGSIRLAVAVTVIEVGLIISIMFSGAPGNDSVARGTIFAAVMIVLNSVVGLSLVLGGDGILNSPSSSRGRHLPLLSWARWRC